MIKTKTEQKLCVNRTFQSETTETQSVTDTTKLSSELEMNANNCGNVFIFRFSTTLDNRILVVISFFRLSFLEDIENRNLNFDFRFRFCVFVTFLCYLGSVSRSSR